MFTLDIELKLLGRRHKLAAHKIEGKIFEIEIYCDFVCILALTKAT